jgi:hypothetical protein
VELGEREDIHVRVARDEREVLSVGGSQITEGRVDAIGDGVTDIGLWSVIINNINNITTSVTRMNTVEAGMGTVTYGK